MMTLYYEGSDGNILNLMDNEKGIMAQNPETLADSSWNYTTVSGANGKGKAKRFYKDAQSSKLKVSIMAQDKDAFNDIMYNMHRMFDRDVRRLTPGKLWWNDFYKEGFVFSTSNSEFEELFESVDKDLEFISVNPYWIKKSTQQYLVQGSAGGTLDYPRDYSFDYDRSEILEIISNECIDKANFEIIFYGPASDPNITIGGHVYKLDTELAAGEYAVINSITKKIRKVTEEGEEQNIFDARNRDSYIFEQIPEGIVTVIRTKDMAVDISIFDERGEPVWI